MKYTLYDKVKIAVIKYSNDFSQVWRIKLYHKLDILVGYK